jgi:hypothetical protein
MTKVEVFRLMAEIKSRWVKGGQEFTLDNAKAYCEDLADLEYAHARAAVRQLAATVEWFPSIAEIRKAACAIAHPSPDADEAWKSALVWGHKIAWGRLKEYDHDKMILKPLPPPDLHPATIAAIEGLGGWKHLGNARDMSLERAHFLKLYAVTRQREAEKYICLPLVTATMKQLKGD